MTITAAELNVAIFPVAARDEDRAAQLLAVAGALVTRYAPGAPDAVQNEATVRVAGWIAWRSDAGIVSQKQGEQEVTLMPGQLGPLRYSGAMALLSPWKVRRGGAV